MTTKEMIKLLIEEKGFDKEQIERLEPKINQLSPDIREAMENWVVTGEVASPEYHGYDVNKLMAEKPLNTVGAYMLLDWLRRDPESAMKGLRTPFIKLVK